MKKILIIFNPYSGNSNKQKLNLIINKLKQSNTVHIIKTGKLEDATFIAKKYIKDNDIVIAAGGDGTIHEVINGINHNIKFGIVPFGTANVLAAEAGIKNDIRTIYESIESAETKNIYLANLDQKKFCLMVGIGFDADIVHNMNASLKKIFGKSLFVFSCLIEIIKFKKKQIIVETNQEKVEGNWVIISKAMHYAGKYKISETTNIFNDNLECYVFQNLTRIKLLSHLIKIFIFGEFLQSKNIKKIISKNFKITSNQQVNVHCDGEKYKSLPIDISIRGDSLNLIS